MPTFEGRTVDADAPFLGAEFWKEGTQITGVVSKVFETTNQKNGVPVKAKAYVLQLQTAVEVDGEEWDRVSVGNLAGFKMAMDVAKIGSLQLKDFVTLTCEGMKASKKAEYGPRINFKLKVERP